MPEPSSKKPCTLIALRHSGTHMIQPIIRSLTGRPVSAPKGSDALRFQPGRVLIVFLRDPRNTLVAHFRYKSGVRDAYGCDEEFSDFIRGSKRGVGRVEHMTEWARRWKNWPGACEVRFEQLVDAQTQRREVLRIKEHLCATGSVQQAIDYTFGKSVTFTGRHSRWSEWFGPMATEAWKQKGGAALLKAMGYTEE